MNEEIRKFLEKAEHALAVADELLQHGNISGYKVRLRVEASKVAA